jgi:hypothetical protein
MDRNAVKYAGYSLNGLEYGVRAVGIHLGQIPAAWNIKLNSKWHKRKEISPKLQRRSKEGNRYDFMYNAKPGDDYAITIQRNKGSRKDIVGWARKSL